MPSRSLSTVLAAVDERIKSRGLFAGDALAKAKARLCELCDATVIVRGPKRGPDGKCEYVEVPDNAIRLAASVRLIEFETGKAPQSIEMSAPGPGGEMPKPAEVLKLMAANPKLTEKIMAAIVGAAKAVQPIDIPATSASPAPSPAESESGGSHGGATPA